MSTNGIDLDQVGRTIIIREKGRMYDHYGILDGRDGIIHVHKKKGIITRDPLKKALSKAVRVSYLDDDLDTRWENYQKAKALIGSTHTYKFFTSNCETMVQKIRTGEAYSKQVDNITRSAAILLLALAAIRAFNTDT